MRLLANILLFCLAVVITIALLRVVSVHLTSSLGYTTLNWLDYHRVEDGWVVRIFDEVVALLRTDGGYRIRWFSNTFGWPR